MKPPKLRNRRKFLRISTNIPCDICDVYTSVTIGKGFIVDFSMGGIGIGTTVILADGLDVMIKVEIPGNDLYISTVVVNERRIMGDVFIYGLRFFQTNIFKRFSIRKTLRKLTEVYSR